MIAARPPVEVITCCACGAKQRLSYFPNVNERLRNAGLCHTCDFWEGYCRRADDSDVARIDGVHYVIGSESERGMRGFGGRHHVIAFFDGRSVASSNLWYQGTIPARFLARLPDNARWVTP